MGFLLLALGVLLPCAAPVCTCVMFPPMRTVADAEAALGRSEAVFIGRVEHVEVRQALPRGDSARGPRWPEAIVRLRVEQRFKGPRSDTLTVTSGLGGGDCGIGFAEGERYLIYLQPKTEAAAGHYVGICGGTKAVAAAKDELSLLERAARRHREPEA
jgi:hypothetical protein